MTQTRGASEKLQFYCRMAATAIDQSREAAVTAACMRLHAPAAHSVASRPVEHGPALGRTQAYSDQVEGFSRRPLLPLHRGDFLAQLDPIKVCYGPWVGHSHKPFAVAAPRDTQVSGGISSA